MDRSYFKITIKNNRVKRFYLTKIIYPVVCVHIKILYNINYIHYALRNLFHQLNNQK